MGSIPVAQAKPEAAAQLADILKSEPATEALLLTQVVADDADVEDEIVTAHAKPVARKLDVSDELPVDRRIRGSKNKLGRAALRWLGPHSAFENFGLGALLLFGLTLVGAGGSMLLEGHADTIAIMGASALCAPGIAAVLLAAYGFLRTSHAKARAA